MILVIAIWSWHGWHGHLLRDTSGLRLLPHRWAIRESMPVGFRQQPAKSRLQALQCYMWKL